MAEILLKVALNTITITLIPVRTTDESCYRKVQGTIEKFQVIQSSTTGEQGIV